MGLLTLILVLLLGFGTGCGDETDVAMPQTVLKRAQAESSYDPNTVVRQP